MCVISYQSISSKQRHHHRPHCIFTQCLDCCIQYIEAKEDIKAPLAGFHAKIRAASLNYGLSTDYRLLFVQLLIAINSLLHKTIAVPWLEYEDFSEGWSVQGQPPARKLRIKFSGLDVAPEERARRTVSATEGWNQLLRSRINFQPC